MVADLEAKAHLLHFKNFGGLAVFLCLLRLLVVVFAPVDYLAYRWVGIWRYFDKVKLTIGGNLQRFAATEYPKLFTILVYYPKLWCTNLSIQARTGADYGSPLYFRVHHCNRLSYRGQQNER